MGSASVRDGTLPHEIENFRNVSNVEINVLDLEKAIVPYLPYCDQHSIQTEKRNLKSENPSFRGKADMEQALMTRFH